VKAFSGKTIRASFWDLATQGRRSRSQSTRPHGNGSCPSAKSVKMTSLGNGPALVVVFEIINR